MLNAHRENEDATSKYDAKDEATLILRILDYKNEYLAWVLDFSLPFTNNLSERSLRGAKSKMKIAGQFQNIKTASPPRPLPITPTSNSILKRVTGMESMNFTPCTGFAEGIRLPWRKFFIVLNKART